MRWKFSALVFLSFALVSFASANLIPDDCTTNRPNIISYWQFNDDGTGEVNQSDAIKGYALTVPSGSNAPELEKNNPQVGQAAEFSGDDSLSIMSKVFNFIDKSYSVEFWFNAEIGSTYSGTIIDKDFYKIEYNHVYDAGADTDTGTLTATVNGVSISSDVGSGWNFVALTVKKADNISLYVNGELVNWSWSKGTFTNVQSSAPLVVGEGFKGVLDELAFSNVELDSSIILSDYSKGQGGNDYCSPSGNDSSGTLTEFVIDGCYSPLLEKPVPLNTCSSNGRYLCVNTSVGAYKLFDTTKENNTCNAGDYLDVNLKTDCCPSGMRCSKEGNDNKYICQQRTEVCSDYDNEDDCQKNNCFWVVDDDEEFCVENPRDYSCSVYYNKTLCEEDEWNLGQEGVGTEVCGTYVKDSSLKIGYRILQGSCRCEWESGECVLAWDTSPDIYGKGGDRDNFTCQKFYNTSACIDGKQTVNWTEKIAPAINAINPAPAEVQPMKATGPAGRKA